MMRSNHQISFIAFFFVLTVIFCHVTAIPEKNLISLNDISPRYQICAYDEEFDTVPVFIRQHCPDRMIIKVIWQFRFSVIISLNAILTNN